MEEVKKPNAPHKKWLVMMIVGIAISVVLSIAAGVVYAIGQEGGVNASGKDVEDVCNSIALVCLIIASLCEIFSVVCMHKLIRVWKVERVVTGQAQPKVVVPQPEKAKPWKIMTFVFTGLHILTAVLAVLGLEEVFGKDMETLTFIIVVIHFIALVMAIVSAHKFILKTRVVKTVSTENK